MKKTKQCPKCGSQEIVRIDGYAGAYGSGNNVMIGATIFSAVPVDRYVCCHCGFTEEWVRKNDLERLKNSRKAKEV